MPQCLSKSWSKRTYQSINNSHEYYSFIILCIKGDDAEYFRSMYFGCEKLYRVISVH